MVKQTTEVKKEEEAEEKKYIAAYGSLRKGCYNFDAFHAFLGDKEFKWIETLELKGFELYSLGAYPCAKIGTKEDRLIVDIIELSPRAYERVRMMEVQAYYEPLSLIIGNYPDVKIFVYLPEAKGRARVKSGDWVKYLDMIEEAKKEVI